MSESCPRPSCCYNDINVSDAAFRCWVQMAKITPHSWRDEMTIKWSSRTSKSHPLYLLLSFFSSRTRKTLAHCQSRGCKRHQATILSTDVVDSLNSRSCVWFYWLVRGLYQISFLIDGNKPLTLFRLCNTSVLWGECQFWSVGPLSLEAGDIFYNSLLITNSKKMAHRYQCAIFYLFIYFRCFVVLIVCFQTKTTASEWKHYLRNHRWSLAIRTVLPL